MDCGRHRILAACLCAAAACAGAAPGSPGADAGSCDRDCPASLGPPCRAPADCRDDRTCVDGRCVPWGKDGPAGVDFDPACAAERIEAGRLAVHCAWEYPDPLREQRDVEREPLVVDFDGDGLPEILVLTNGKGNPSASALVALSGATCEEVWRRDRFHAEAIAAADLDGDGGAEVVGYDWGNHLWVLRWRGGYGAKDVFGGARGTPAIAELDGQPPPEIVIGADRFRWTPETGLVLLEPRAPWNTVFSENVGPIVALADVDGDALPEIVWGNVLIDGATGAIETPPAMAAIAPGIPALADFFPELPGPEIVSVHPWGRTVTFADLRGEVLLGPLPLRTGDPVVQGEGGPPTVADFDGDGAPEVAVGGAYALLLFDPSCEGSCAGDVLRWSVPLHPPSDASAAAFDFDLDGAAEVVYHDRCWLRILDGDTGAALCSASVTGAGDDRLPVIADVDGDGHAEIVVSATADDYAREWPVCPEVDPLTGIEAEPPKQGIWVYRHPEGQWPATRPIWNQHTFHGTNVNDDGTVPFPETPSWEAHNSYRAALPLPGAVAPSSICGERRVAGKPLPDLTVAPAAGPDAFDCGAARARLAATVHNRGAVVAPPGVRVTFRAGSKDGPALCDAETRGALAPGAGETVSCESAAPIGSQAVHLDVDAGGLVGECIEANNRARFSGCVEGPG